jgi:superfamily II DNA or RNA helicase
MSTRVLELRDYQEAILGKLRNAFIEGHRSVVLVAPTGAGKTEMAMALLSAAAERGNRAAMVLDRVVLCNQTSARLDSYGFDHGVMQAGHWRFRPYEHIQVCSAQTLEKRGSMPGMKVLIVDECHNTRKQTIEFIKNNPGVKVVGLTATPFTKGLGKTYTAVVSAITTRELVEQDMLVPLRVYIAKEIDMAGAKKVAGEWSSNEAEARGIQITGDVVAEWVKKTHEVFGGPRKTVVFAAGVKHAADLAQKFSEAGYNFVSLSYKDDDEFKAEAIKEFSKPESSIVGLIATDILTKGFDVPDVMIGVSARPFSKSLSSHIQQMGRVMRKHPSKEFALWLDHSGNYLRFAEDWEDIYANGVDELDDGKEKPKKEPTEREKEAAKCPRCNAFWPGKADTCACCGFVRPQRGNVTETPGELAEYSPAGKKLPGMQERQEFYSELCGIASERGYKRGWAFHKYREKYGVDPKGLSDTPAAPSAKTMRWVRSRQIAWANSRKNVANQEALAA